MQLENMADTSVLEAVSTIHASGMGTTRLHHCILQLRLAKFRPHPLTAQGVTAYISADPPAPSISAPFNSVKQPSRIPADTKRLPRTVAEESELDPGETTTGAPDCAIPVPATTPAKMDVAGGRKKLSDFADPGPTWLPTTET